MGDDGDLQVGKDTVNQLTKGITAALDELREIGTDTDAAKGSGFDEMAMTKKEVGHKGLADAFEDFCEKWEWGVRGLMADADGIAQALGLSAGMNWEEDRYRSAKLKGLAQAVSPVSNPHQTEEDLNKGDLGDAVWGWGNNGSR
ncbi:hypothetical protein [Streptomyces boncukensis]|uniref:Uncharacterized protein n=1 Tax=Streptomyces boncukensis TaxID=2711219 RepID=A0A6G4XAD5_9ACTN|nr:hypothetical protein [Streptomyces boncukensis]NGO73820.1 hypothetical protein [Streptomyces boncukensis]